MMWLPRPIEQSNFAFPRLVVCLLLAGLFCSVFSTLQTEVFASRRRQAPKWQLTFRVSGGFAGLDRALVISSNGDVSAEDRRKQVKASTKATASELKQISSSLDLIKGAAPNGRSSQCRDCLLYEIESEANGQRVRVQFDDTTLQKSGLADLTSLLSTLLSRTLSPK
jgi:hypothetical protein